MSKSDEAFPGELKKETSEVLIPGQWYWIVSEVGTPSTEQPMRFWVNEIPTEPGSRPLDHELGMCYVVEYQPAHDDWLGYGDKAVCYGGVKAGEDILPGYITSSPSAASLDMFLRWGGGELSDEW
jgi:hypothetical protein